MGALWHGMYCCMLSLAGCATPRFSEAKACVRALTIPLSYVHAGGPLQEDRLLVLRRH